MLNAENGIPKPLHFEEGHRDLYKLEEGSSLLPSMTTVIQQESERFNLLLNVIRKSLENLVLAINGTILMSSDLDSVYAALLNNQVPAYWEEKAYPSLKPLGSWVKDLKNRIDFMNEWLELGTPVQFWMSGLFYPQGFMTGVLQTHARRDKIPIDKLNFSFKVLDVEKGQVSVPPVVTNFYQLKKLGWRVYQWAVFGGGFLGS